MLWFTSTGAPCTLFFLTGFLGLLSTPHGVRHAYDLKKSAESTENLALSITRSTNVWWTCESWIHMWELDLLAVCVVRVQKKTSSLRGELSVCRTWLNISVSLHRSSVWIWFTLFPYVPYENRSSFYSSGVMARGALCGLFEPHPWRANPRKADKRRRLPYGGKVQLCECWCRPILFTHLIINSVCLVVSLD